MKEQIEVITYEQDRLNYFTDLMKKAQERYKRLFKKHKDAPYASEEAQALSDAGRETHFLGDVVGMLEVVGALSATPTSAWISVEDRLPESGAHCLLCCELRCIDGTRRPYVCDGFHVERFNIKASGVDDDVVTEYNEEDDEYYLNEGWYEVIKNWEEYSCIVIDDFVTHWMPLPEPPKMKGETDV